MPKTIRSNETGFTLIELLLVIAIILILGAILLFAINPAEQLRKSRDSQRISDLNTLATAINLYLSDVTTTTLGTATSTYYSILTSQASGTCETFTPVRSLYNATDATRVCNANGASTAAAISDGAKTDSTGWVPIDLEDISSGSPITGLPYDPLQTGYASNCTTVTTCGAYFYRFTSDGTTKWAIDAVLESTSNQSKCSGDGGNSSAAFEIGNDLTPDAGAYTARTDAGSGCA